MARGVLSIIQCSSAAAAAIFVVSIGTFILAAAMQTSKAA